MTKSTVAWFVFKTTIKSPIVRKWRVTRTGENTFTYKGIHYVIDRGLLLVAVTRKVVGEGTLKSTDKARREAFIESECRRACDPNSDLYWSM